VAKTRGDYMKERLVLKGWLTTAILAAMLLTACPPPPEPEYTVSFCVGEGSGSPPASQKITAGASVTLPGQGDMTALSGKTFGGWENGWGKVYEAGTSVAITVDMVFTAQWLNSDEVVEEGKTYVLFRNMEEFAVSIYRESNYVTEIALVPAFGTKRIESDAAPGGITFYPRFHFMVDGLPVFTQDDPGIVVRVDANKVTEVMVPRPIAVTVEKAYLRIENQSYTSLTLTRSGYELTPLGAGSPILMHREQGLYEVQVGSISGYAVRRNANEVLALPQNLSEFKRGMVYTLTYDETELALTYEEDILRTRIFIVSTAAEMRTVLDSIHSSTEASAWFVIGIAESFSLESVNIKAALMIMSSRDGEKTISLNGTGSLFSIASGATLTLGNNVTLRGRSGNTASLVLVNSGGSLEMTAGSKITGNTASYGGGVRVYNGTFTMSGGAISGNTASNSGGGVCVDNSGTFTMSGGAISGNTTSYGGGVLVYSGTFTMSGGAISGNTASNSGGGVCVGSNGTFTMSGGAISGNTTSYGGGVYSNGTFTKQSGGTIYGSDASTSLRNTASSSSYGHAAYVYTGSKKRNTTAGTSVTLYSSISGSSGGWE
jgi:hypothetical protein